MLVEFSVLVQVSVHGRQDSFPNRLPCVCVCVCVCVSACVCLSVSQREATSCIIMQLICICFTTHFTTQRAAYSSITRQFAHVSKEALSAEIAKVFHKYGSVNVVLRCARFAVLSSTV